MCGLERIWRNTYVLAAPCPDRARGSWRSPVQSRGFFECKTRGLGWRLKGKVRSERARWGVEGATFAEAKMSLIYFLNGK